MALVGQARHLLPLQRLWGGPVVTRYLGIDPGPTPGFVLLMPHPGGRGRISARVVQCDRPCALSVLEMLLSGPDAGIEEVVAIERFVVGRGSMRSGRAGEVTRGLIGSLQSYAEHRGARVVLRSAAEVKPWATDGRLAAAGLLEPTKGMRHAKDAARHALFAAVKDGVLPDPLSKRSA